MASDPISGIEEELVVTITVGVSYVLTRRENGRVLEQTHSSTLSQSFPESILEEPMNLKQTIEEMVKEKTQPHR